MMKFRKNSSGEKTERISFGRLVAAEGYVMRGKQSSYANYAITFRLNLSAAGRFMQSFGEEKGVKPSITCLLIRASAIALKKHPRVNDMLSGNGTRIIKSSSIDIGVSVSGQESFSPVIVLRDADKKSLIDIIEWLESASDEARKNEQKRIESLNAMWWILPLPSLRRAFLRYYVNSHHVRKDLAGTFQISTLHRKEVTHVSSATFFTTALLIVGGVSKMPFEVNGEMTFSPGAELTLNADHRMLDGMEAVDFGSEIIGLMEDPKIMSF
jgi:pyruvate dehydrogenase E2 component (dihydrolipoamide acetyltransferase)